MSTLSTTNRDARLDLRLNHEHKRIIAQAATATGQSLSDFAVGNLLRAARQVIEDASVTRLSLRDRDIFLKLIDADAQPNKALKVAAKRYRARHA